MGAVKGAAVGERYSEGVDIYYTNEERTKHTARTTDRESVGVGRQTQKIRNYIM